jgi:hypothetical protein
MSTKQGPVMSKMSELDQDIQIMLDQGRTPVEIALALEIPISWVFESAQAHTEQDVSPYATINS